MYILVKYAIYTQGKTDFPLINSRKCFRLAEVGQAQPSSYVTMGALSAFCYNMVNWLPGMPSCYLKTIEVAVGISITV